MLRKYVVRTPSLLHNDYRLGCCLDSSYQCSSLIEQKTLLQHIKRHQIDILNNTFVHTYINKQYYIIDTSGSPCYRRSEARYAGCTIWRFWNGAAVASIFNCNFFCVHWRYYYQFSCKQREIVWFVTHTNSTRPSVNGAWRWFTIRFKIFKKLLSICFRKENAAVMRSSCQRYYFIYFLKSYFCL